MARLLMSAILFVAGYASAAEPQALRMEGTGKTAAVILPGPVKAAIEKVAPGFKPWKWQDYVVWVREDFVKWAMPNPPYAVVADFNNDGVNDLVIDGHTDAKDVLIAVVSTPHGYQARVVSEGDGGVSKPGEMKFYEDEKGKKGRAGVGLKDWLQFQGEEKGRDASYAFTLNFSLVYDANGEPNEPGFGDFYLRAGKFEMECSGEFCPVQLSETPP